MESGEQRSASTSPPKSRVARHRRTRSVGVSETNEIIGTAAIHEDAEHDGGDGEVYLPRRTKSFESHDHAALPLPRMRTYTKSLGSLVKHLASDPSNPHLASSSVQASPACGPGTTQSTPLAAHSRLSFPWPSWPHHPEKEKEPDVDCSAPLPYEFALLLHNKPARTRDLERQGLDEAGVQQRDVIRRCIDAGLEVTVMTSTLHSRKYMCLLLKPTFERMKIEKNRLVVERWLQIGAVGEVPSEIEQLIYKSDLGSSPLSPRRAAPHNGGGNCVAPEDDEPQGEEEEEDRKFTPAERIQTIGRIISSTADTAQLNPPGAGISIEDPNLRDPIIAACFPLHNRKVNKMLLRKKQQWWRNADDITDAIRFHYGEHVAFHFAFLLLYTQWLVVPAVVGTILYLSFRWYTAIYYMTGLSVFGYAIVTVWGTAFLKAWQRKNEYLNDVWNVRLFKEADYPNPRFRPHGFLDIRDNSGVVLFREPYYNSLYRIPAYIQTLVVFLFFTLTYVVGISFFVQWYTAAMCAPVCSECPDCTGFLSCFDTLGATVGTSRWFYIFVQGIFLGATLDVFVYLLSVKLLRFFVIRENHTTEAQVDRTMINRLFIINWISFFLWFMLIAFVIVPFGKDVEEWINTQFHWATIYTVNWHSGRIDMSTALVTPLLITQALNLLIDTALPHALRKHRLYGFRTVRKLRAHPAETMLALSEIQSQFQRRTSLPDLSMRAAAAATTATSSLNFQEKIELQMITPIRIPYIEAALGVTIPTTEGFYNEEFMTADSVVDESQLELYETFPDYLKMVIQFGYVVMFSVVWPFCGLAAVVNNVVHIQNCFHKLCLTRRRPVPRKANSIGQWEKTLYTTLFLAVFAVVGLICLSSGEVEYFVGDCLVLDRFNGSDYSMTPELSCFDLSSRFLVALVLEHIGLFVIYLIMDNVEGTPESLRSSFQMKKELIRRAICGQSGAVTTTPNGTRRSPSADAV
ncbi:hypothetical protein H310_00613 [Aphanomyces invadans]|uniref:Anoctamin transmembrane domain-containing protein n=1 Tax=Aphanomyces invadans TaxID=157072 RepID=A0A024UV80_9STRA|nr:hypothetical protein H310_00613 [Aphanomyces invadans]ETW10264.1 hypothetical protein H310_00613 [Aphanomyces invadans]|eukprot:XP_008861675.1 hypothetical protein H310_00613 [Aphanomyces invadans]